MALPSETSDTREQFTWSHCYDMSLTATAPCHASVTSETRRERQPGWGNNQWTACHDSYIM